MRDGFVNTFRNLILAFLGGIFLLCLSLYISSLAFLFSEYPIQSLSLDLIVSLKPTAIMYTWFTWWIANFKVIKNANIDTVCLQDVTESSDRSVALTLQFM